MDDYERVLLVKPDVHVYKIPPRVTNRAYRASDWNLDTPDWNCRLRLISKGDECYLKLDEKSTGQFFGKCPIDKYPGTAVESVSDSSRYFVLRLLNEQTGRTAFVGIGFVDRSDSFDLNVSLQDHFKSLSSENKNGENNTEDNTPKLDLKFKEGQTIKVNLNIGTKSNSKPRPKPMANIQGSSGGILLPPPPSNLNKSSSLSFNRNTDGIASTNLLIDHSETQEQKAFQDDNVDSSIDKNDGDNDSQSNPISVPDWVCFKSTESTLVDNGPFSSNITTKPIDDGSVGSDLDKDLWSDFTSCNPTTTTTTTTDSSASETTNNNKNKFDDWAKFF